MIDLLKHIPDSNEVRKETQENELYQKEMIEVIKSINNLIDRAKKEGRTDTVWGGHCHKYEDELKRLYKDKGYRFKPTGVIGGVYQTTEQICW